jgi:hypothetical protein
MSNRKPALVLAFLFLQALGMHAQFRTGDVFVTLGGAASFTSLGVNSFWGSNTSNNTIIPFSSPALCGNVDFLATERISIGGCYSWQQFGNRFDHYIGYYNYYQNSPPLPQSWTDTYNRYNIAGRVLYHFLNTPHINMYLGARAGYTYWTRSTTNSDPTYDYSPADKLHAIFLAPFSLQSVFGMRYMFNENFGLNAEAGIGAPYAFLLGLCGSFEGIFPSQHASSH